MAISPGQLLLDFCKKAKNDVSLVAPFVKAATLKKIFECFPSDLVQATIITRWIPEEIAVGVCDLEIYDLIKERQGFTLRIHPCLHAKYYRIDSSCLVGSANLTDRALGWSSVQNIEILLELNPNEHRLHEFEVSLKQHSILVTETIRKSIEKVVFEIRNNQPRPLSPLIDTGEEEASEGWLPTCISPENLFQIYKAVATTSLLKSVVEAGKKDLDFLGIIPGLTEEEFKGYISAILEQIPAVQEIDFLSKSAAITTEAAIGIVSRAREQIREPIYDKENYWLVLKNWLLYFFPNRYRTRAAVEVFEQARIIR